MLIWTFQEAFIFSALFRDVSKSSTKSLTRCVQDISIHMILLFSTKTQTFPHSDTGKNPDRDKDCRKINHCMKTNPTIEWPGFARGHLLIRAVLHTPIKHNKSHPRVYCCCLLMSKLFIHQCFVGMRRFPRFEKLTMRCIGLKNFIGYNLAFISRCIVSKTFVSVKNNLFIITNKCAIVLNDQYFICRLISPLETVNIYTFC